MYCTRRYQTYPKLRSYFHNDFACWSALFRGFTQRRKVVSVRRFGTNYRSHLQESRSSLRIILGLLDPWWWDPQVVPKRLYRSTFRHCVKSQKSTDASYIPTAASNHGLVVFTKKSHPEKETDKEKETVFVSKRPCARLQNYRTNPN